MLRSFTPPEVRGSGKIGTGGTKVMTETDSG